MRILAIFMIKIESQSPKFIVAIPISPFKLHKLHFLLHKITQDMTMVIECYKC